jgi:dihydrodipicolinate synthase/N-acetylneuraminate lyase
MKLKETDHLYYCLDENYYNANPHGIFNTWKEFKSGWLDENLELDDDLNHLFRFDIKKNDYGTLSFYLYFMLQRKGIFLPIEIKTITKKDMPEIENFLASRWEYLKKQWIEFSE